LCIVALSFFGNQLSEVETPYWHLAILQAMLGMGMGLTVAPATTSFMSALPRDKAGTGSAVTNAFRQIGGALGVAILGSVIASVYRTNISSSLSSLPPELQKVAGESLGSTLQVVGAAPELENPDLIVNTALHAYVDALHAGTLVAAVAALCGAAVAFKWLPKKGANPVPEAGVSHGADFA